MHHRISTTLQALRQDLAARLGAGVIHAVGTAAGHTWCDSCLLTPAAIIHWFPLERPEWMGLERNQALPATGAAV